ncbi:MAG: hypothetical protein OXI27_07530 [Thaumarchaeota archaeon]|nr:hypothetical protein [Nitrososphaerota archaeon]
MRAVTSRREGMQTLPSRRLSGPGAGCRETGALRQAWQHLGCQKGPRPAGRDDCGVPEARAKTHVPRTDLLQI